MPDPEMKNRICRNCRWYHSTERYKGECRRNPPVVMLIESVEETLFPEVLDRWWCGSFDPTPQASPKGFLWVPCVISKSAFTSDRVYELETASGSIYGNTHISHLLDEFGNPFSPYAGQPEQSIRGFVHGRLTMLQTGPVVSFPGGELVAVDQETLDEWARMPDDGRKQ